MINRATSNSLEEAIDSFEETWTPSSRELIGQLLLEFELSGDADALTELIRIDIELRNKHGLSFTLQEYFDEWNHLLDRPANVAEIAFEDYRSRSTHGHDVRISRWSSLPGVKDEPWFRRLIIDATPSTAIYKPNIPSQGPTTERSDDAFEVALESSGFGIIHQISAGAFSKVYLATQNELADRYVVLKVVEEDLRESRSMALLQHTNIVPIYSVHHIHSRTVICMPYAGSVTLKDFLSTDTDSHSLDGQGLIDTVEARIDETMTDFDRDKIRPTLNLAPAADEQAALKPLESLRQLDHNRLTTWIFVRLAAALAHSHARGILHGDLKPGNVLIRNDGEPALLDFNLSQSLTQSDSRLVGGTLPYMSPEAYRALMMQQTQPQAASDIYSLGVMMFQFVTGRLPHSTPPSMAPIDLQQAIEERKADPQWQPSDEVTPSLRSIIDRCLAFDASDRYVSADDLRIDLENDHSSRALSHAPETYRSRITKWFRRHPSTTSGGAVAALLFALAIPLAATAMHWRQTSLHVGAENNLRAFMTESVESLARINADPGRGQASIINGGISVLERHGVLAPQGYRRFLSPTTSEAEQANALDAVKRHATQMAILEAKRLRVASNQRALSSDDFSKLDQLIGTAKELPTEQGSRSFLFLQAARAKLAGDLNYETLQRRAEATDAASDSELYLEAVRKLTQSDYSKARELFTALADRNTIPSTLRWTLLARSQYSDKQYESAKLSITQSIQRAPESSNLYLFRARCHAQLKEGDHAIADFTKAIELNPNNRQAYANRGLIFLGRKQFPAAIADFTKVQELLPGETYSLLKRSKAYRDSGQIELADQDFADAISSDVVSASSLINRAIALEDSDPGAALEDLRHAERLAPDNPTVLSNQARILSVKLHQYKEAIEVFDRVIRSQPNNEDVLVDRAIQCAKIERFDEALAGMEKALAEPNSPRTLFQAACVCALLPDRRNHQRGITLLAKALHAGYEVSRDLAAEQELKSLHSLEGFRLVHQAYKISNRTPIKRVNRNK